MGGFPFEISPREANVNPMLVHFPSSRREVAAGVKSECVRKGDRTGKLAKTVRKLLAERDGRVERGVLTRAHICPRGVLTMGRLANFDPPSYSIRSTMRSRISRATTPENIGPSRDFDRLGRAMDDYVIGLRGRSVLGYTVDRGTRPEGTWWKEVKRRRHYRRATCMETRRERMDVLKSNVQKKRSKIRFRQKLSKIFYIL